MIIYGWRNKLSASKPVVSANCTACGKGPLHATTNFRYFHIYWIPIFPFARSLWLTCDACQGTFEPKKEDPQFAMLSGSIQKESFPPFLFSGLVLAALLLGGLYHSNEQSQKRYQAIVQAPQAGDVLVMKLPKPPDKNHRYGVGLVLGVSGENVQVATSSYFFRSASTALSSDSIALLSKKESYSDEYLVYPKPALVGFLNDGTIAAAERGVLDLQQVTSQPVAEPQAPPQADPRIAVSVQ